MVGIYTRFRDGVAKNLLTKFNQGTITLRRVAQTTGALAWGAPSGTTPTDYALVGVVSGFNPARIDGTLIKLGDLQVIVGASGLAVVPDLTDTVIIDGVSYAIVNVTRVPGAGATIVYRLQVRTVQ